MNVDVEFHIENIKRVRQERERHERENPELTAQLKQMIREAGYKV